MNLSSPGKFVTQAEHGERRVIAVGLENAESFGPHVLAQHRVLSHGLVPDGKFDLQQEAGAVGGEEGGFRRTVGVEPEGVQAIVAGDAEDALPCCQTGGRIARKRPDVALYRAAQKHGAAVQQELRAARGNGAQANGNLPVVAVAAGREGQIQRVNGRIEFIP